MKHRYINTVWEVWDYDVWGNTKDGYDVNDRYCVAREYSIRLRVEMANVGTDNHFDYATPTDTQLRKALSLKRIKLDTYGDDLNIYVRHYSTGYPCGELHCISHVSLSPIRETE